MIGKELILQLKELGAEVHQADITLGHDLRSYKNCLTACAGIDYVFHLAGVKGSPKMTNERPIDFMLPMLQFDTNMIKAAQASQVQRFLYTSSIAVLNPQTDKYPAWAKMTGEMLIEAMRIQYPVKYAMSKHLDDTEEEHNQRTDWHGTKWVIVRPANVYGRYDNFKNENAMVITSLIRKSINNEVINVWGDGSEIRDFINAKDVAKAMIKVMEITPKEPTNLASGEKHTIKEVAEIIAELSNKKVVYILKERQGPKIITIPIPKHFKKKF